MSIKNEIYVLLTYAWKNASSEEATCFNAKVATILTSYDEFKRMLAENNDFSTVYHIQHVQQRDETMSQFILKLACTGVQLDFELHSIVDISDPYSIRGLEFNTTSTEIYDLHDGGKVLIWKT